jgi:hypothetical protein
MRDLEVTFGIPVNERNREARDSDRLRRASWLSLWSAVVGEETVSEGLPRASLPARDSKIAPVVPS